MRKQGRFRHDKPKRHAISVGCFDSVSESLSTVSGVVPVDAVDAEEGCDRRQTCRVAAESLERNDSGDCGIAKFAAVRAPGAGLPPCETGWRGHGTQSCRQWYPVRGRMGERAITCQK
jgi:hypothetical protein